MVVVRAAAPKAELERIARNGGGGAGWGGEGVTSTSAELRGRLEPLVYCRGFGYANVESNEVIDVHKTPFDCGSCARILTAIAALQLWQEDHVRLSWLPPKHLTSHLTPITLRTKKYNTCMSCILNTRTCSHKIITSHQAVKEQETRQVAVQPENLHKLNIEYTQLHP
jgi:hypothetical protein